MTDPGQVILLADAKPEQVLGLAGFACFAVLFLIILAIVAAADEKKSDNTKSEEPISKDGPPGA